MGDPVEFPPWYGAFRADLAGVEDRLTKQNEQLRKDFADEMNRKVNQEAFEAEKRFQNERWRTSELRAESDRQSVLAAIQLEKTEREDADRELREESVTAIREEAADRLSLQTNLDKAEADRKFGRRWMWGTLVAVAGIFVSALAVLFSAEIPRWFG